MIHRTPPATASAARFPYLLLLLLVPLLPARGHATDLPIEGGPGGAPFRSTCSGDFVVGMYVRSGVLVDSIGLKCAAFNAAEGRFKRPEWNKAFHGGPGGSDQTALCPGERFVSGLRYGFTREGTARKFLDYIELNCRDVGAGPPIQVCLQTGHGCWDRHPDPPVGGGVGWGTLILLPAVQECPAGEAVIGIHGRSGKFVDAIGLLCGPRPRIAAVAATPPAPPPPAKPPRKLRLPVRAIDDVDVYDSPVAPRRVIATIPAGTQGRFLEYHPDGWCRLDIANPRVTGWVARDHLRGCPQ